MRYVCLFVKSNTYVCMLLFDMAVCDWPLAQVLELYMESASSALYVHGFALTAFYANEIWLKYNCTCYQPGVISFQNQQTQPSGAYHFQERLNLTSIHTLAPDH